MKAFVLLVFLIIFLVFYGLAIPIKVFINVPFICQAPDANWEEPWQNACEEAVIVMAIQYARGSSLNKNEISKNILKLIKLQEKKYGQQKNLTAREVAILIRDFYDYKKVRVCYSIAVEDIKKELAQKHVVLVPVLGRALKNSCYRLPGPLFHYLLLKGYDDTKKEFITNDPGTKSGNSYCYKYEIVYAAVCDGGTDLNTVNKIKKVMLVVESDKKQ